MNWTRAVEFAYGAVALITLIAILIESVEDCHMYVGYQHDNHDGSMNHHLSYARFRLWQDVFGAITQIMMMLAAAFALTQNYLPGHHPYLATGLIAALVVAELGVVVRVFRRRRATKRMMRAMDAMERQIAALRAKSKGE